MKHHKWLLLGSVVSCLAIILLAGCGMPQSGYEALQAEHATLLEENSSLKAEYKSLQAEHIALMEENTALKTELEQVQAELTEANIEEAYATLEKEYAAIEAQLADIKKVYPPRHFSDHVEFLNWLNEHLPQLSQVGTLKRHLELQEMALADGYIWSVVRTRMAGIASYCIAGDIMYWIDLHGNVQRIIVVR